MKKKICTVLCLGMIGASVLTAGCGTKKETPKKEAAAKTEAAKDETAAKETKAPTATPTPTEEPKPELKAIGTKSEQGCQVQMKNCTGLAITGVAVTSSDAEGEPENLLTEGDSYAADEERILYYTPAAQEDDAEQTEAAPDAKALAPAYDILLTFENDMVLTLHSFPFGDVEQAELYAQDSVAFLKYKSVQTKELVDTKEAELAVKAAKEAEAAAQEEVYEEPAYDESYDESYDGEYYEDETYYEEEPYYEEEFYEEPSYEDDGSGGDDSCLDGGLLY